MISFEKVPYGGWPDCYRLSNGETELILTTDVGPRIIRYGFVNGQNLFKEFPAQMGTSGESEWVPRGGHRIWIAPEDVVLTYARDNGPVQVDRQSDMVTLTQSVEPETGLVKQISVRLEDSGTAVKVTHRLTNHRSVSWQFAPWALTMMAAGGYGITGFPPRGTHPEDLPPTHPLIMWAFSDLTDPRWTFTKKYLVLRQDSGNTGQPTKLGHFNTNTWGAYLLGSDLFLKRYTADPAQTYPDFQASFEIFTNAETLELETLGPLTTVEPGSSIEHVEYWTLHRNVEISSWSDAGLDLSLLPLLK
ncbi:MAG: hypothetical protein H7039_18890 [Bryobacteraceae bacterium]|nr:hypothetical protein [Bryobacteraceae bacterium]